MTSDEYVGSKAHSQSSSDRTRQNNQRARLRDKIIKGRETWNLEHVTSMVEYRSKTHSQSSRGLSIDNYDNEITMGEASVNNARVESYGSIFGNSQLEVNEYLR